MAGQTNRSDPTAAFRAYLGYLEAFSTITASQYAGTKPLLMATLPTTLAGIRAQLVAGPRYQRTTTKTGIDFPLLSRALKSAWGSELLLCITPTLSDDEEFKKVANNWATVQAYYSCYHISQALTISQGNTPPNTHAKLQNVFTSFWTPPVMNFPPWSLGWKNDACSGLHGGITLQTVHAWSTVTVDSCWSFAAMVLRTTRQEILDERKEEQRRRGQRERQKQRDEKEQARAAAGRSPLTHRKMPKPILSQDESVEGAS